MNYKIINIEKDPINKYTKTLRPLFIDFELYTEGDNDFKKELISLMIDNIHELQKSLLCDNKESFISVCHKVKATIAMLCDDELTDVIQALKTLMAANDRDSDVYNEKVFFFDKTCLDVIESLQESN